MSDLTKAVSLLTDAKILLKNNKKNKWLYNDIDSFLREVFTEKNVVSDEREVLLKIKEVAIKYPIFSEAALRFKIQNNKYGISKAVKRVGNLVFIKEKEYLKWLNGDLK